ncbi:uncharacterized protein HD556DRAFT_954388 [Suillus plorans]|uniref:Uncharacterized protein n=1 Tax=Suillus plorans TaxID=116603 RepID=A0A9P7DD11_9AGAM|nr:uncharacterized protein HD556DRAFT_954388 [Suillus plorans]KAG1787439.1 hypothetical protein HD556DRAFT_954388 [Suillus plorans]
MATRKFDRRPRSLSISRVFSTLFRIRYRPILQHPVTRCRILKSAGAFRAHILSTRLVPSSCSTWPGAVVAISISGGYVSELDPLQTSPCALDELVSMIDSPKKHARRWALGAGCGEHVEHSQAVSAFRAVRAARVRRPANLLHRVVHSITSPHPFCLRHRKQKRVLRTLIFLLPGLSFILIILKAPDEHCSFVTGSQGGLPPPLASWPQAAS